MNQSENREGQSNSVVEHLRELAEQQLNPTQRRGQVLMTSVFDLPETTVASANTLFKTSCNNVRQHIGAPEGLLIFFGGAIPSGKGAKLVAYGVYSNLVSLLATQEAVLPHLENFPQPDTVTFTSLAEAVTPANWYETRW